MDCLFILGAGTSVDSGLFTYRTEDKVFTPISCYDSYECMWDHFSFLHKCILNSFEGPTYKLLKEIVADTNSAVLTQNVDGYANKLQCEVIELHGNMRNMYCMRCKKFKEIDPNNLICECGGKMRPDVILLDEPLSNEVILEATHICKRNYKYVVIIGTTLQFPYLRKLISLAKGRGAKVIHINPDPNYNDSCITEKDTYSSLGKKLKVLNNVRKGEVWIQKNSYEGLLEFADTYLSN